MDVFFYETFKEEEESLKAYAGENFKFSFSDKTIQETGQIFPPAPIICIRTQSKIPTGWEKSISGILSRSTGYDHLIEFLSKSTVAIPCGYLNEYATRAVAEHAVLLMFALNRRLFQQSKNFIIFNRDGLTGYECYGKNLIVVGVGRIGKEIADIGEALGMNVFGVDIDQKHKDVKYLTIEKAFNIADVVVCSMNLTQYNIGYFSYEIFEKIKVGSVFINVARGELSPTDVLYRVMTEGRLRGVGLDVYDRESEVAIALRTSDSTFKNKFSSLHQLMQIDNVILTPHNAFNTIEAVDRKSKYTIDELNYFFRNNKFNTQI